MIISAIADVEKMEATEEDVNKELEQMAKQYNLDVDKIRTMLGAENFAALDKDIKMKKAVDFVFDNAKIK